MKHKHNFKLVYNKKRYSPGGDLIIAECDCGESLLKNAVERWLSNYYNELVQKAIQRNKT